MLTADRPDDPITVTEAAHLCGGIHSGTIHKWIRRGQLDGWKCGGKVYVSRARVLEKWQRIVPGKRKGLPPSKRERRAEEKWIEDARRHHRMPAR